MLGAVTPLREFMTRDVLSVAPEDTLGHSAERMVERGAGSAVVTDYGRLIGILTERDVLRAVAGRVHSSEATVREWMTPDPVTVSQDATAEEAAQIMLEKDFRHLPVVEGERAIGVVSIRDVARHTVGLGAGIDRASP
jgi:CBS domain-containing protein